MKTLTIFRHAKSSWDFPDLTDHDRPLNKRGERDAPVMAERLQTAGVRPSLILSSPAVRAWRTAKMRGNTFRLSGVTETVETQMGVMGVSPQDLMESVI